MVPLIVQSKTKVAPGSGEPRHSEKPAGACSEVTSHIESSEKGWVSLLFAKLKVAASINAREKINLFIVKVVCAPLEWT